GEDVLRRCAHTYRVEVEGPNLPGRSPATRAIDKVEPTRSQIESRSPRMISVVIPIYNEEEIIALLHHTLSKAMREVDESWEVVYVNDGSKDSSLDLLRQLQADDPRVVVVELSRNWGHMGALNAGLQTARGDAIV